MVATDRGHTNIVQLLLDNGSDVNVKAIDGKSPLFLATKKGHTEIIELLKRAGAKESRSRKREP